MKTKILANLVAIAGLLGQCATAQTNDTYAVLRTLDGTAYRNVEVGSVTATHLIVSFDGGGAGIPFTNLPPEIQRKYHFDPAAAANAEAARRARSLRESQQRQAQAQQDLSWRGETVKIRILQMNPEIYEYKITSNGVPLTITMFKLPNDVTDFVQRINSASNSLADLKVSIVNQRQYAARQRAFANAMQHYADDGTTNPNYAPKQYEANLAEGKAQELSTEIGELTAELAKMRQEQFKRTTILARPTKKFFNHQVWEFVGMPSDDDMDMNAFRRRGRIQP
jgi:hypothetical protein